jgi:phosphatidate cytidylyltransferase
MTKNLKTRIYTSAGLFILLILMLIDNLILGYFTIVVGILSILEFFQITQIILKKNKSIKLITNLLFIFYIFSFCSIFLIFSSFYSPQLKFLIFVIILTCVASDIGGFVFGKIFKGVKLTKISPNKTVSGSIGSLIFSVIFIATIDNYIFKVFDNDILIVGFITSIASQLGDLFFSYLKRKSSIKDTGSFLPGHGGILDRIDGILLGFPVGMIALSFFY